MTVDREGFEAAMKEQQERARASAVKGGSMGMQNETLQNITVESVFNYNASQLSSKLVAIVADNAEVEGCQKELPHLSLRKRHSTLKWVDR